MSTTTDRETLEQDASKTTGAGPAATPLAPWAAALQLAHETTAKRRANGLSVKHLDPVERARRNPRSLRAAISGKCWSCCGGGADPNTRQTIRECTVYTCPLHGVRPYQHRDASRP